MPEAPTYQQTGEYQPGSGPDLTSGYAAQEQLAGGIEKEAFGIAQTSADQAAAQQGAKDALEQGKDFRDSFGLTEAGKAYNRSANPIAQQSAVTQLATQFQGFYQQELDNGITANSQASLAAQMKAATQTVTENSEPAIRAGISEQAMHLGAALNAKISNKLIGIHQTMGLIANDNERQTQNNTMLTMANTAGGSYFDGSTAAGKAGQNAEYAQLQTLHNEANLGQISHATYHTAAQTIQSTAQSTAYLGEVQNTLDNYNTADSNNIDAKQRAGQFQAIQGLAEKALNDPRLSALTYSQRQTLVSKTSKLIKNFNSGLVGNKQELTADQTSAMATAKTTGQYPSQGLISRSMQANAQTTTNHFIPKAQAYVQAFAYAENQSAKTIPEQKNDIIALQEGKGGFAFAKDTPQDAKDEVSKYLVGKLQSNVKAVINDPQHFLQTTSAFSDKFNNLAKGLSPEERIQLKQVTGDPSMTLSTALTPGVRAANTALALTTANLGMKKGLTAAQAEGLSKDDAKNIVNKLRQKPEEERVNELSVMQTNYGNAWPLVARSLYRNGLGPMSLVYHSLASNGAPGQDLRDAMYSNDMARQPLYGKPTGTLYPTDYNQAKLETKIAAITASGWSEYDKSIRYAPESQANASLMKAAFTNYVAYKVGSEGKTLNQSLDITTEVQDAKKLFFDTMYSHIENGYRIPKNVATPISNSQSTVQPLVASNVYKMMSSVSSNVYKTADVSTQVDAYMKRNPGATKSMIAGITKSNILGTATWRTLPDDSGMYLVGSDGLSIINKDGTRAGFRFADTLPGSPVYEKAEASKSEARRLYEDARYALK